MSGQRRKTRVLEARSCLSAATKEEIHLHQLISHPLEPSLFLTPKRYVAFEDVFIALRHSAKAISS
jgi:hypothetical protein